jgi:hypothetical protein
MRTETEGSEGSSCSVVVYPESLAAPIGLPWERVFKKAN